MWPDEIVKIGEIMELNINGEYIKTKLQDLNGSNRFTVFAPAVRGSLESLAQGDILRLRFYRPSGVFEFIAKVCKRFVKDNLRLCMLEALTEVEKSQRRKSYRLRIVLKVILWCADDKAENPKKHKAKTADISEHGMLVTCFDCFEPGTLVFADLKMPDHDHRVFETQVQRCEKPVIKTEPHKLGLIFVNATEQDRAYLGRFILRQQIIARKKRVLGK